MYILTMVITLSNTYAHLISSHSLSIGVNMAAPQLPNLMHCLPILLLEPHLCSASNTLLIPAFVLYFSGFLAWNVLFSVLFGSSSFSKDLDSSRKSSWIILGQDF